MPDQQDSPKTARALVVIPTYNEADNLARLVGAVLGQGDFDVLIIDDNSPDGTGNIAEALRASQPSRIEVMHRQGMLGLGTAYVQGFKYALQRDYPFVFEMDADFSHDPKYLPEMLQRATDAEVVVGSRYVPGGAVPDWSATRRLISWGGSVYARLVLGLPVHDPTSGFKCFQKEALQQLDLNGVRSSGFAFQVEMNWRCHRKGFRMVEVPIVFLDRREGQSKMSAKIFFEAMILVWRLRLERSGDERGFTAA